jgi:single-strand DNA-binding protein
MASVNKIILLGHCGRDAEIRYLPSGAAVANVTLATSSKRKDKVSGEVIEDTQWHRLTFYERLAEIAGDYIKKGTPIYVEGRIKYGKYTGQDGIEKNTVDIVVTELQLLGSRQDNAGGQDQPQRQAPAGAPQQREQSPGQRARTQQAGQQRAPARAGGSGFDDMDDDIPFQDPLKRRGLHLAI